MMSITKSILVLILCLLSAHNHSGGGPTLEDLQKIYEKEEKLGFLCIYDGHVCIRGEEFCSNMTKSCKKLFTGNISTGDKIKYCSNVLDGNHTQTEVGLYDGCFFFRGSEAIRNDLSKEGSSQEYIKQIFEKRGFPCIYNRTVCVTGQQFCSGRAKSCKELFAGNISTDEKIKFCLDVVQGNDTQTEAGLYDGCFYFLCSSASINDTVFKCATTIKDNADPTDTPTNRQEPGTCEVSRQDLIELCLSLGLGFGNPLLLVFIAVSLTLLCRYKNWLCFKKKKNDRVSAKDTETSGTPSTHIPLLPLTAPEEPVYKAGAGRLNAV